jgi:hypothetical protein
MAIFYIGGHTEYRPASAQYTHYYTVGSQRVAMREHTAGAVGSVYYTLTDHLGSTNVTLNSAGAFLAEMRYKPWGESRYTKWHHHYSFTRQLMTKIRGLIFLLVIIFLTIAVFIYQTYAPLHCDEMMDIRLLRILNSEYNATSNITEDISSQYSIEPSNIHIYSQEEATLIVWNVNQTKYLAYYKDFRVRSIWVSKQGLLPKYPNGFELINCFGNPTYARIQFITHEIGRLEYQLWYFDQGIVFQGGINVPHDTPLIVTNNERFDTYIIFDPTSLEEAVENVYVVNSQAQKDVWIQYIQPWSGSWSGIEIQMETP